VKDRGARVKILAPEDAITWGLARQAGEWQTYTYRQLIRIFDKASGRSAAAEPTADTNED
jgi:hypothetical protein